MILSNGFQYLNFPNFYYSNHINTEGATKITALSCQYPVTPNMINSTILIIPIPGIVRKVNLSSSNILLDLFCNIDFENDINKISGMFSKDILDLKSMQKRIDKAKTVLSTDINDYKFTVEKNVEGMYNFLSSNWTDVHITIQEQSVLFNGLSFLFGNKINNWSFVLVKINSNRKYTPLIEILFEQKQNFNVGNDTSHYFPAVSNITPVNSYLHEGMPALDRTLPKVNNIFITSVSRFYDNEYIIKSDLNLLNQSVDSNSETFYTTSNYYNFYINNNNSVMNGDVLFAEPTSNSAKPKTIIYSKHLIN